MNDSSKYFFDRAIELLHRKAFDTYRVSLHNPFTIFDELEKSIDKYNKKRILHFKPTITSILEEADKQMKDENLDLVFSFGCFTKGRVHELLNTKKDDEVKTLKLLCRTICYENRDFKSVLFKNIKLLLIENNDSNYSKIDVYTSWLISQLIHHGYSRKYINNRIYKSQENIESGISIEEVFDELITVFLRCSDDYEIVFRVKCNKPQEIRVASSQISKLEIIPPEFEENPQIIAYFKEIGSTKFLLSVKIKSYDFWSALRIGYQIISETIELNVLHDSDNRITLFKQALVIHTLSKEYRMLPTEEALDGFYKYQEAEFYRFIDNFKKIPDGKIAREKIKSAIRFYKLGNESLEIEHKILNYWIGFEQLYSAVDSKEDSIMRIKSFFIAINAVYYLQRRTNYLLSSSERAGKIIELSDLIPVTLPIVDELNPLIKTRITSYIERLNDKKKLIASIEKHTERLEQHLTRIYRVRNELVHEGRTSVDLFLIAGHLRHYLLFSIEQITNELVENPTLEHLDDVFVYFETLLTRIKSANNIQEVFAIKEYKGYME